MLFMNTTLTPKQKEVFDLIVSFSKKNKGDTPTLDWLRQELGCQSINSVVKHLKALEVKGAIARRKHAKENNIIILEKKNTPGPRLVSIPVIASVGCDNMSVFAQESVDEYLTVDSSLIGKKRLVAIRAEGDSMNDAGVENGDYALVEILENGEPIKNGEIVTAIIDGMAVLKRYEKKDGLVILYPQSKNPQHKPIIVNQSFRIIGRLWQLIPGFAEDDFSFVPEPSF